MVGQNQNRAIENERSRFEDSKFGGKIRVQFRLVKEQRNGTVAGRKDGVRRFSFSEM